MDVYSALETIAEGRGSDPLSPVTIITPSHSASLQQRRYLAQAGPFAAVRFETLPRIAEILGAGHLAGAGKAPLARPIGDYLAEQVALESRGVLERVADLHGYARALRRIFRRLRRGGIRRASDAEGVSASGHLPEIMRLYDLFRERAAAFYDEEDLLDAAAAVVREGRAGALADLGEVYLVPPGALTAAGKVFLASLENAAPSFTPLEDIEASPDHRFILAPDPATEAREASREVIAALESGVPLHEIAVFHGADQAYLKLLRETFTAAGIPAVPLPGVPLAETRLGRGVLALARLPEKQFSRTAVMDFLAVAPLRDRLPAGDGTVRLMTTLWDKVSREAGITRGAAVWSSRLLALVGDLDRAISEFQREQQEGRIRAATFERDMASQLRDVAGTLVARVEPLRQDMPARSFIDAFKRVVYEYLDPASEGFEQVEHEIEQLGTVGAVGGSFSLETFERALSANLEAASVRPEKLGNGVVIADYRTAPGLRFRHVIICGAQEGLFPAGPGTDALIDDRVWRTLRERFPDIEDASARIERAEKEARRAVASSAGGRLVWSAALYEPGGTRDYYPSPLMVRHAARYVGNGLTASQLRRHGAIDGRLHRGLSPLSMITAGPAVDTGELAVRKAIFSKRSGQPVGPSHPRHRALQMLGARRSYRFTEWDGNVSGFSDDNWAQLQRAVSPTSLENYSVCGFRYFCRSLLRLNVVEEPEEREMMDAATRGQLVHQVLDRFYRQQKERGRPAVNEHWTEEDSNLLLEILDDELKQAALSGKTGLDIYAEHETRIIRADLRQFLDEDTLFRIETGAVPHEFEVRIPETEVAGVTLRGVVDRVDLSPDGSRAWVIDYKTGSAEDFKGISPEDPLAGGRKLQLPTYLAAAADAEETHALYWFITRRGGFEKVGYVPTEENRARFEQTVEAIVEGVRSGAFPAVSDEEDEFYGKFKNCRFCDFDRICSRRRDHELAAKREDGALGPWLNVGRVASGEAES